MKKIELTKGFHALVDDDDYVWLSKYSWRVVMWGGKKRANPYAVRNELKSEYKKYINRKKVSMHRQIMSPAPDEVVDHINENTLDNRKENLECVSVRENALRFYNRRKIETPLL